MVDKLADDAIESRSATEQIDNADEALRENSLSATVRANISSMLTRLARFIARNYNNLFAKIPLAVVFLVILAILIQGLFEHVTVIESISVPQSLSLAGYTPEVARNRLRDAIADLIKSANSHMPLPNVALQGDLPDIVVPTVGISLDAVLASLRTLFRLTRSRTITGEFTIVGNQLFLRLRIDGQQLYRNDTGGDPNNPDALLKEAAQSAVQQIRPYYVPASISNSDPTQALVLVNSIISQFPNTDVNVIWAYNLKGVILTNRTDLTERNDYSEATAALATALQLDPRLSPAYVNMGNILSKKGDRPGALAKYKKAIAIDPTYSVAHNTLGLFYQMLKQPNDAIDEFRKAIKYDFGNADYHFNLAYELAHAGAQEVVTDESLDEYRQAIVLNPNDSLAHNNLGQELQLKGRNSDAIAEYQEAFKDDPTNAFALANLKAMGITPQGGTAAGNAPPTDVPVPGVPGSGVATSDAPAVLPGAGAAAPAAAARF